MSASTAMSAHETASMNEVISQYDLTETQAIWVRSLVMRDLWEARSYWNYRAYNSAHVHASRISAYSLDGRDGSERGTLTDIKV